MKVKTKFDEKPFHTHQPWDIVQVNHNETQRTLSQTSKNDVPSQTHAVVAFLATEPGSGTHENLAVVLMVPKNSLRCTHHPEASDQFFMPGQLEAMFAPIL